MEIGVKTDIGRIRDINQDAYYISSHKEHPLFIIADGMGGHKAGEIASRMAVEIISSRLEKDLKRLELDDSGIKDKIVCSISKANEKIYRKALEEEKFSGMGTTVTLAYKNNEKIFIGHVGDSRAYLFRKGVLSQITKDHSLVEELIRNGSISKEEAKLHPQRNIITRAVGTSKEIESDLIVQENNKGDILLLCTDGLTNMLMDEEIKEYLLVNEDMQKVCDELVKLSNDKGGYDNITVLAIKF
ncbi:Serine/threonine phosphatase stp [[Clostridium] ultunense Esp]|uniref:Serine/threonine phosphatase stp n=1 Tax=[Clostridium] ultunense Esp TaxID=1288971 RepID=M1YZN4_9FIRM|nr:Stp1/IreP family PP2C-type Ser/Thr phosphatase [Schnuerera ultunensis]CCQ96060.1 Serine/threonine phosphatase stp [[Clostridium] ultunense Esp]SHD76953.1 Serine/threonine phosphatase stp [[Clostridium] ultunense Esp]